jgi:hypothetical protein
MAATACTTRAYSLRARAARGMLPSTKQRGGKVQAAAVDACNSPRSPSPHPSCSVRDRFAMISFLRARYDAPPARRIWQGWLVVAEKLRPSGGNPAPDAG